MLEAAEVTCSKQRPVQIAVYLIFLTGSCGLSICDRTKLCNKEALQTLFSFWNFTGDLQAKVHEICVNRESLANHECGGAFWRLRTLTFDIYVLFCGRPHYTVTNTSGFFYNFMNHDVCSVHKNLMRMVQDNYLECVKTNSPPTEGYTCGQVADLKSCIVDYAASHCDYATEWLFSRIMDVIIRRFYTRCETTVSTNLPYFFNDTQEGRR
ncbi:hypothetical protein PoB_001693000 [Plakobranchus ocellatus]|uniref:Uncharacterized protein n=1 Tax=Plakobranchus ocellatus TaxID=259542 RepID=A0AAV3Z4Q0_9GAST|nr:hypothetical protein PoB_001693000 [Plakobranchus ocellatus]